MPAVAELPERSLSSAVSRMPYRRSSSGPSYNERVRVGAFKNDPTAAARSALNATVGRAVDQLMEQIEYFQEDVISAFLDVLREVSGRESLLAPYPEEPDDYEEFQRPALTRSIHRMLNEELRARYSTTFFRSEELLGDAQEAAAESFLHNSNRNRMSLANLAAIRGLIETKKDELLLAFNTKMRELETERVVERLAEEDSEFDSEESDFEI